MTTGTRIKHPRAVAKAAAAVLLIASAPAAADPADDWTARATLYLWGAGISGETARGADVDMGFDQLIEHLNYADIGTGESELTWQLGGGVACSFGQADAALWYRHMAWEFEDGEALTRISFSGPMLSGSWRS